QLVITTDKRWRSNDIRSSIVSVARAARGLGLASAENLVSSDRTHTSDCQLSHHSGRTPDSVQVLHIIDDKRRSFLLLGFALLQCATNKYQRLIFAGVRNSKRGSE